MPGKHREHDGNIAVSGQQQRGADAASVPSIPRGGFVSGMKSQRIATARTATAVTPKNPAEWPHLPTTRPDSDVLSDAPIPEKVPINPCARLNRPVPL